MKTSIILLAAFVGLAQSIAAAEVSVADGSQGTEVESYGFSYGFGTNVTTRVTFIGNFQDNYLKQVEVMEVFYSGQLADKPVTVRYALFPLKEPIIRTRNRTLLPYTGRELQFRGVMGHADAAGNITNYTTLCGFLMNDERTITSSWFISTNCALAPPTEWSKFKATLKQPLLVSPKELGTNLSTPIWLFKIGTNYALTNQQ